MTIRLEPRMTIPRWLSPVTTIGAVVVALLISALILAFVGGDPVRAYLHILDAAFGDVGVLSDTLVAATPLILTGLACALAFRMRLWNIGAEGQFLLGAWGASAIVLAPILPAGTPAIVVIPAMMVAGAIAGGVWGFIPGVLKARLGVNEIITSLMLNYVALFWIQYWVFGPWSEGGFQQTEQFPREAWLPRLTDVATRGPGVQRPDHPPRVPVRAPCGDAHLVPAEPDARRLRDPPDRRQPACRAVRRHRHQAGDHRRLRHLRRPGRPGRDERGRRRGPPPPGPHLAGLRLHGDHHCLPRPLRTVPGRHCLRAVRGAHPGGA